MKKNRDFIISILILIIVLNMAITHMIQRMKDKQLTTSELLLLIPKNFIWKFDERPNE